MPTISINSCLSCPDLGSSYSGTFPRNQSAVVSCPFVPLTAEISRYQDSGEVSSFAEDAVVWAVGNRILMGKYEETILDPRGGVSRAESAALLMRFMKTFQL